MRNKPLHMYRVTLLHLYRGTPAARAWSKHQRIDREWTLCGIQRRGDDQSTATEDEQTATCQYCRDLAFDEHKEPK